LKRNTEAINRSESETVDRRSIPETIRLGHSNSVCASLGAYPMVRILWCAHTHTKGLIIGGGAPNIEAVRILEENDILAQHASTEFSSEDDLTLDDPIRPMRVQTFMTILQTNFVFFQIGEPYASSNVPTPFPKSSKLITSLSVFRWNSSAITA